MANDCAHPRIRHVTHVTHADVRCGSRSSFSQDTFVNLGARSGLDDDPLQFLVSNPLHVEFALAAEMDPELLGVGFDEGNAVAEGAAQPCPACFLVFIGFCNAEMGGRTTTDWVRIGGQPDESVQQA